jgi:hypothetical protein
MASPAPGLVLLRECRPGALPHFNFPRTPLRSHQRCLPSFCPPQGEGGATAPGEVASAWNAAFCGPFGSCSEALRELDAEPAHQSVKRRAIDAERACRGIAISSDGIDRLFDSLRGRAIEEFLQRPFSGNFFASFFG